jgi:hypothetical protein
MTSVTDANANQQSQKIFITLHWFEELKQRVAAK